MANGRRCNEAALAEQAAGLASHDAGDRGALLWLVQALRVIAETLTEALSDCVSILRDCGWVNCGFAERGRGSLMEISEEARLIRRSREECYCLVFWV